MVKRKKNGPNSLEDDKRNDEGTPSETSTEVPAANSEINEPPNPPNPLPKNRIHVTRTSSKEFILENNNEQDASNITCVDKGLKVLLSPRFTNRTQKRLRKEPSPIESIKKPVVALKQDAPLRSKTRRPWELWSVEDKNSFFEALCEYGKDFENIQSYIAQRSKKKGTPANMIKNKDQVRHFYYRTWHKISKFLDINDDVRKHTQEIYGLINYAELRKKIGGCLNEKNRLKLNELVFNGVTTVKYKGKKLRIKTPVCRALKKLNNVAEAKEPEVEKLPKDIVVELCPHTNKAWMHVQDLAQNPRVRTKIPLQRRIKSVIEYLQHKWKPYRVKRKEQILSSLSITDSSLPPEESLCVLRIRPQNDSKLCPLLISAPDSASSTDVCLEKYLQAAREPSLDKDMAKRKNSRLKLKSQVDSELVNKPEEISAPEDETPESAAKDAEDNYNINLLTPPKSVEEADDCCESALSEAQRSLSLLSSMMDPVGNEEVTSEIVENEITLEPDSVLEKPFNVSTIEEMYLNSCQDGEMLTLGQILSMNSKQYQSSLESDVNRTDAGENRTVNEAEDEPSGPSNTELKEIGAEDISCTSLRNLKDGWTIKSVGLLTIGELYLMLGRPSKIVLEYEFEVVTDKKECSSDVSGNFNAASQELAESMKRLINVATCTFVEFRNKQTPLSPTYRNLGSGRNNPVSQALLKSGSRCTVKSSAIKTVKLTKSAACDISAFPSTSVQKDDLRETEIGSATNSSNAVSSDGSPLDSHVFVVPVGTAPRVVKKPNQESLREEIDKLLPSTRRGCRVRRKPLIVQRPLLPRDGISNASRPMTLVHLVPSGSQLTAVIPPNCAGTDPKTNVLPSKKVVKILSAGPPIDVHPVQVPLLKQMNPDSSMLLQPKSLAGTRLVMAPAKATNVDHPNVNTIINTIDKNSIIITPATGSLPNMPDVSALSVSLTSVQKMNLTGDQSIASSPPQISIPDSPCPSSVGNVAPFLEISMVEGAANKIVKSNPESSLLTFSKHGSLSAFSLSPVKEQLPVSHSSSHMLTSGVTSSENTPPQSPPGRPFKINSPGPEAQWLNGESVEFSLNTLLNTLESPSKVLPASSSSISLGNENCTMDPITRLAPVVDSQVRCLLEECSVDFIAKFEDLADVINSGNIDTKPS